jgi:hypothetical protein
MEEEVRHGEKSCYVFASFHASIRIVAYPHPPSYPQKLAREAAAKSGGGMGPIIAILVVLLAVAGYFITQQ